MHPWVGILPYGVTHTAPYYRREVAGLRSQALGFRSMPWDGEVTVCGQRAGLKRWANKQASDPNVWYAAFNLAMSAVPLSEVAR